jgi:hypothetical protein
MLAVVMRGNDDQHCDQQYDADDGVSDRLSHDTLLAGSLQIGLLKKF